MSAPQPSSPEPSGPAAGPTQVADGAPAPAQAAEPSTTAAAGTTGADRRAPRRKAPAWPAPVPQATPEELKARSHGPGPAPARRKGDRPEPTAASEPATPARPRLEGTPISLAGSDTPAMLLPPAPSAQTPTRSTPAVPPVTDRPAPADPPARAALSALSVPQPPTTSSPPPGAPVLSSPPPGTPQPDAGPALAASDPSSKAPPGFAAAGIRAAESPTLLALDPVEAESVDTEPAGPTAPAPIATIGGSALLATFVGALPRGTDLKQFGKDAGATRRVLLGAIGALLLVILAGPSLVRVGGEVPLLGGMFRQLEAFTLYPGAYGIPWVIAGLGAVAAAGVVVAQMESTAHKQDRRADPATRLNIALAGLVTLALVAGGLTLGRNTGWSAGGAAFAFFLTTCLLIPAWNLPGARAMAPQPARAWALLLGLSSIGFVIAPGVPLGAIAVLSGLQVRRRWGAVRSGEQDLADGPVDATNRLSALVIVAFVVIVAAIGMRATTVAPSGLRDAEPDAPSALPGVERGPTIAPPEGG